MANPKEIELHVGHFGDGTGAHGIVDEVKEATKITKRVYDILRANNVPATYYKDTVSKSQTENINRLIAHHNADTNGLIVSIHLNASAGTQSNGIGCEVCYTTQKALATTLSASIATAGGFKNRGAKYRDNIGVLVRTKEPAVLLEPFFVNSKEDVELYNKHFEKICQAIATALAAHIGHKIKSTATVETASKDDAKDVKVKGTIKTLDKLNYYDGPRWTKPTGEVKKGTVLTVTDRIYVGGAWQYKTVSGTYITASSKYVTFTAK